jgi:ankyrin repeat protein
VEVVQELLAHKADPNRLDLRGYRPLHNSAVFNQPEIARVLLEARADPNAITGTDYSPCGSPFDERATPLDFAAKSGAVSVIAELVKHGANLNCRNWDDETPLHSAARSYLPPAKVVDAVKSLIAAGADINAKGKDGKTPLDCAIEASRTADKPDPVVVNYLRQHGAK